MYVLYIHNSLLLILILLNMTGKILARDGNPDPKSGIRCFLVYMDLHFVICNFQSYFLLNIFIASLSILHIPQKHFNDHYSIYSHSLSALSLWRNRVQSSYRSYNVIQSLDMIYSIPPCIVNTKILFLMILGWNDR